MDRIIRKINVQVNEALTLASADNVAVVSKTVTELQETLSKWNSESRDDGMKINEKDCW